MFRRITAAGLVLAATTFGVPAGTSSPAAAQSSTPHFVSGDFIGDERDEVFAYAAGEPHDAYLVTFDNGDVPGGALTWDIFPFTGTPADHTPVAGDFDGDGRDEIFWYGPGSAPDSMWHFQSTSSVVSVPFTVAGVGYLPLAGDYTGDGTDDIHWYAAGPGGDPLWEFDQAATYTSIARNVNGTYRPVVASIGKDATDDTIWYGPGGTADSLWDWTRGTTDHTTVALSVGGTSYTPFRYDYFGEGPRSEDVYWYAQGPAGDPVWEFFVGDRFALDDLAEPHDDQVDTAVSGDWFADGLMDILFITNADMSDFTIFDSSFETDFVYDIPGGTGVDAGRGGDGVTPDATPRTPARR